MRVDVESLRFLYAGSHAGPWAVLLDFVSFLGSGWMLWALLPVFLVRSLRRHRGQAVALLGVVGVTAAAVSVLKIVVGRARPCHALAWLEPQRLRWPNDFSFPSGHAAGAFAVAAFVFAAVDRRLGGALFVVAALVAFSRVALGMHYPTDVLAGAVLGTAIGLTSRRFGPTRRAPA